MASRVSRPRFSTIIRFAVLPVVLASISPWRWYTSAAAKGSGTTRRQARPVLEWDRNGLRSDLSSSESKIFKAALDKLSGLDDETAVDLWQVARSNPHTELKLLAWREYRREFPRLSSLMFSRQIVRFRSAAQDIASAAAQIKADVSVFGEDSGSVAAAAPYSLERLRSVGLGAEILYPSISEMAAAARAGDARAAALYSSYIRTVQPLGSEVRIAVVDLSHSPTPAPGYSRWLGDGEDFLLQSEQWLACLDVFQSDGSAASVSAHVHERYTRRGYTLAGFYTPAEFSTVIGRFFPGRSFNPGTTFQSSPRGGLTPALSNGKFHSY